MVAMGAAGAWVVAGVLGPAEPASSPVIYWNSAVLLGVLVVVVQVLDGLRTHLIEEQGLLAEVQKRLLPVLLPSVAECSIAAAWRPAGAVGGDYYDVLTFDDGSASFCIGDVSGKGVPAALLMSNLQAALRALATEPLPPEVLCARLNSVICRNVRLGTYVTFFFCRVDPWRGRLTYTCAGHNPPLLMRADGSCLRLTTGDPVLGIFPNARFTQQEVEVHTGDTLVLYTDGVTERQDARGAELGEERLRAVLKAARRLPATTVVDRIVSAVESFGQGPVQDDLTLVVVAIGEGHGGESPDSPEAAGWRPEAREGRHHRPGAHG